MQTLKTEPRSHYKLRQKRVHTRYFPVFLLLQFFSELGLIPAAMSVTLLSLSNQQLSFSQMCGRHGHASTHLQGASCSSSGSAIARELVNHTSLSSTSQKNSFNYAPKL
ncbi:hypothetical protein TRVL_00739 [Trypanosoma vivax]|nr:hypothetical protein TRVL_00739 [Trypanosoma vivax]